MTEERSRPGHGEPSDRNDTYEPQDAKRSSPRPQDKPVLPTEYPTADDEGTR